MERVLQKSVVEWVDKNLNSAARICCKKMRLFEGFQTLCKVLIEPISLSSLRPVNKTADNRNAMSQRPESQSFFFHFHAHDPA